MCRCMKDGLLAADHTCLYGRVYAYAYVNTNTCVHTLHAYHERTHTCAYIRVCIHSYCIRAGAQQYTHTAHAHTYKYMHTYMHIVLLECEHTCAHTHTHTNTIISQHIQINLHPKSFSLGISAKAHSRSVHFTFCFLRKTHPCHVCQHT